MPTGIRAVRNKVLNIVNAVSTRGDLITFNAYATGAPFGFGYEMFDMSSSPTYNAAVSCAEFRDSSLMMLPVTATRLNANFPYNDLSVFYNNNTWNSGTSAAYNIMPTLSSDFTHILVWRRPFNSQMNRKSDSVNAIFPGFFGLADNRLYVNTGNTPWLSSFPILNTLSDQTDALNSNTFAIHPYAVMGTKNISNNNINVYSIGVTSSENLLTNNTSQFIVSVVTRTSASSAIKVTTYTPNIKYTVSSAGSPTSPDPLMIKPVDAPSSLSTTAGFVPPAGAGGSFMGLNYGSYSSYGLGFYGLSAIQYSYPGYDFPGLQITVTPAITGNVTLDGRPGSSPIVLTSANVNNLGAVLSRGSISFTLSAGGWNTPPNRFTVRQYGTTFNFTINNFSNCGSNGPYHNLSNGSLQLACSTSAGGTITFTGMTNSQTVANGGVGSWANLGGSWTNSNRGDYAMTVTENSTNHKVYLFVSCKENGYGTSFIQYFGVNYTSGQSFSRNPASGPTTSTGTTPPGPAIVFSNLNPLETYLYEIYDNLTSPNYAASKSILTVTVGTQGGSTSTSIVPQNFTAGFQGFGKLKFETFGGFINGADAVFAQDVDRTGGTSSSKGVLGFYQSNQNIVDPGYFPMLNGEWRRNTAFNTVFYPSRPGGGTNFYASSAAGVGTPFPVYPQFNNSNVMVAVSSGAAFNTLNQVFTGAGKFGQSTQALGVNEFPPSKAVVGGYALPGVPTNNTCGWDYSNIHDYLTPYGTWIGTGWPSVDFNFFLDSRAPFSPVRTINPSVTAGSWPTIVNSALVGNNFYGPAGTVLPLLNMPWFRNQTSRVYSFCQLDDDNPSLGVTGRASKTLETLSAGDPNFIRSCIITAPDRLQELSNTTVRYFSFPIPPGKYKFKWVDSRQMKQPLSTLLGGPAGSSYWDSLSCINNANIQVCDILNGQRCKVIFGKYGAPAYPWWMEGITDDIDVPGAGNPGATPTRVYRFPAVNVDVTKNFNVTDVNNISGPWPLLWFGGKSPNYYPPLFSSLNGLTPGNSFPDIPLDGFRFSLSGIFDKNGFSTFEVPATAVRIGNKFIPPNNEYDDNGYYTSNAHLSVLPYIGNYSAKIYDSGFLPVTGRSLLLNVTTSAFPVFFSGYYDVQDATNVPPNGLFSNILGIYASTLNSGPFTTAANRGENYLCNTPLSADIREILFYNRSLSDTEEKQVVYFLNNKWGLNLTAGGIGF